MPWHAKKPLGREPSGALSGVGCGDLKPPIAMFVILYQNMRRRIELSGSLRAPTTRLDPAAGASSGCSLLQDHVSSTE
jgi:hypothetical protein